MQEFKLSFSVENDAFQPADAIHQAKVIAAQLRLVAYQLEVNAHYPSTTGFKTKTIFDVNGNSIGSYVLK